MIPGAECYVGRNDNPSFSACAFLPFSIPFCFVCASTSAPHIALSPPHPPKKNLLFSTQVGSEPLGELTGTIWHAVGPSGPNKVRCCALSRVVLDNDGTLWQDYVYNLAAAVRALAPEAHDSHLYALEVRC